MASVERNSWLLRRDILAVFTGSLLFQIVQVGAFPILIAQLLNASGVSAFQIGFILAISWVVVFLAGPFVPRLIQLCGEYGANSLAFLLAIISLAALEISTSILSIVLSSVAMGLSLIVRWINCDTMVVHLAEDAYRGRTIGLHEALMGLGIGLGPLLFVQGSLEIATLTCLGITAVAMLAFAVGYSSHRPPQRKAAENRHNPQERFVVTAILAALIAAFVSGFVEVSSIALLPLYFENVPFSLEVSAILVSSFGFGGTLLQPALGTLADRSGYFVAQMICVLAMALSCVTIIFSGDVFFVALISLFVLGGAAGGLNTLAVIEAGQSQVGAQVPAAMTAIAMLYTFGSIAGPVTAGAVLETVKFQGMPILFASAGIFLGLFLAVHRGFNRSKNQKAQAGHSR